MLFAQAPQRTRRAFTLIELLTVVIIIGILAGLVTAAAIRVRISVRKASHALELKQFEMALHAYKERFGEFPPDFTGADEAAKKAVFARHLRKAFPRCTVDYINTAWTNLGQHQTPATALTFWLGGIKVGGTFTGFSANPTSPFEIGGSRIGPFYAEFDGQRLCDDGEHYYPTVAAVQGHDPLKAIWYLRADNSSYSGKGAIPFMDSRIGTAPNFGWINPRSFQILSPGLQGGAFVDSGPNPAFPAGVNYQERHLQMMSNFTGGTMEDELP
ncbi:MAG: type II secretion system protein [Thermoguttaceae bacterium]|jgi:prepilin-type N-terminal cleavage/methylation domain-containing protein|nr:type II secretion system protein [Thermoguttaceae bacterium]